MPVFCGLQVALDITSVILCPCHCNNLLSLISWFISVPIFPDLHTLRRKTWKEKKISTKPRKSSFVPVSSSQQRGLESRNENSLVSFSYFPDGCCCCTVCRSRSYSRGVLYERHFGRKEIKEELRERCGRAQVPHYVGNSDVLKERTSLDSSRGNLSKMVNEDFERKKVNEKWIISSLNSVLLLMKHQICLVSFFSFIVIDFHHYDFDCSCCYMKLLVLNLLK